jgi:hypothetical protein
MSTLHALAKARASARGFAQPVSMVRHVHLAGRPLVLLALTLAGEANAPLAAMVGDARDSARLLVVSQPRNRDQRFEFAARLAEIVTGYLGEHESILRATRSGSGNVRTDQDDQPGDIWPEIPQIIVPNEATIGFLRLLGRSTRLRRPDGPYPVDPAVPVLGRWLTFLSERAEMPGSSLLVAATQALALHWASGQSAVEDRSLAALMGWIDPPVGMTGREAAAAAEDPVSSPPAGPATDPTFDNEVLAPLIARCGRPDLTSEQREHAVLSLRDSLSGLLVPTWRLVWRAVELLRGLPPGLSVRSRCESDCAEFLKYGEYVRDGGTPQPRRDSAVAAAIRLNWLEQAQARYAVQRAFDDPLVMAEYRMSGEAFGGPVTGAEPHRLDESGRRRKLRPLVTVETVDALRIGPGEKLVSPARPGQSATVVSVTSRAGARAEVVLELTGGMGRSLVAAPGSVPAVGEQVCYTTLSDSYQPRRMFPDRESTPWTHGGPPPVYVPVNDDVAEAWS